MTDKTITNFDDYYAHIPAATTTEEDASKKKGLKLKVKAKKVEETPEKEVLVVSPEVMESPAKKVTVKEKKSTVAIIWSPKDRKKEEQDIEKPSASEASKPVPKNAFVHTPKEQKKTPFVPRVSFSPAPVVSPIKKDETKTPFVFTPRVVEGGGKEKKVFGNNKPKGGSGKSPFSFGERHGGKKTLKTRGYAEDDGGFRRSGKVAASEKKEKEIEEIKQTLTDKTGQEITIPEVLTVKEFSEKIGVPLVKIITELMKNGMMVTINTKIDFDTCFLIGEIFGIKIIKEISTNASVSSLMEGNIDELLKNDDVSKMVTRAPIVSVMGHVDHGKTSILDYIRNTEITKGEAGGITQKIGAYQVEKNGKKITFLDTPGHEAFSIMRARGAKLTDLAVIVIAGDEGMKPQTIESINHAKEAGVPMIIAVNKMDKPGANVELVYGQLAEQGLQPEKWGGDVIVVPVSAHTGLGINDLLDMILLSTEMMDLKATIDRPAIATVIESHLDAKLGPLATVLVNTGTIKKGDYVACGSASGRVRFLRDFKGKNVDHAGPSVPVLVSGMSKTVGGGDILQVVPDSLTAAEKAHEFELVQSTKSIHNFEGASLDLLLNRLKTGGLKQLKVVLKCESNGSLEALKNALSKLSTNETRVTFIHSAVGDVNDSDVVLAGTSQAILIAYNVGVGVRAKNTLANSKIEFIDKKVIYHVLDRVEAIITGMVDTRYEDVELGDAKVKAIFYTGKDKMIVGLEVLTGKVENRSKIRIIRDGKKIANGEVANLKSGLLDVNEVEAGNDCGISYKGDVKPEIGDVLEMYKTVIKK
ncbi:MAG: translation initiation factor IF-2 [Candidatus Gracilibacteria bacterium]|nr:translation initiation factor IF-2 [Candidatus Gracilibacteria bacterium]